MGETHMVKELGFLEEILSGYEEQMTHEYESREKGERDRFAEIKEKRDMLVKIMKLVRAESLNMEMREAAGHYDLATLAQMLLNESATARIDRRLNGSAKVMIFDEVHEKYVAKFHVKISRGLLLFTRCQFF